MRDVYVITNGNSVGGIAYTKEDAERIRHNTTNGLGTPLLRSYDIVRISLDFSDEFETWYNEEMMDGGEDIYMTDGDCLLAGVEEGQVIDAEYLVSNLEWCKEADMMNIAYWNREGDDMNYTPSARKHIRWCNRMIKAIRSKCRG